MCIHLTGVVFAQSCSLNHSSYHTEPWCSPSSKMFCLAKQNLLIDYSEGFDKRILYFRAFNGALFYTLYSGPNFQQDVLLLVGTLLYYSF